MSSFAAVVRGVADDDRVCAALDDVTSAKPTAVVVGQYLAALGIITDAQEEELHAAMIAAAVGDGHSTIAFKAHPSAPPRAIGRLEERAGELGARIVSPPPAVPVEAMMAALGAPLVVGCFSTALFVARRLHGCAVVRVGTDTVLDALRPFENSNRMPLVLADAALPPATGPWQGPSTDDLTRLVRAVGYVMQPSIVPMLRPDAESFLTGASQDTISRYFDGRRLAKLDLPGARTADKVVLVKESLRPRRLRRSVLRRAKRHVKRWM